MNFYTNVALRKNKILLRGIKDGMRVKEEVKYSPYLFIPSNIPTEYKTLDNKWVKKIHFDSSWEAREYHKKWNRSDNYKVYGLDKFVYTFINDEYNGPITYNTDHIRSVFIDIEVDNKGQSIDQTIELANREVTAITLLYNDKIYAFGCGKFINKDNKLSVQYYRAYNEADLLKAFINIWVQIDPDVVSGWNINGFDIPFILNRITNLLGEDVNKSLSTWGIIDTRDFEIFGKKKKAYTPLGVAVLDYLDLYKKFTYVQQESNKLDWIAFIELGERKLDYSDYDDLYDLHAKNFQLFMEYNIRDTWLVKKLDDKLKFINQVLAIAYDSHINFVDALTSVKLWDVNVHNYLLNEKKTVIPPLIISDKSEQIKGAYVKEPRPGYYKHVLSFDLDGLYPHLIMGLNISPEMLFNKNKLPITMNAILNGKLNDENIRAFIKENDVCVAATGYMFSRKKRGFFPELMNLMYEDRKKYKKLMLDAEQEYEKTHDESLKYLIVQYNNMQMAKKICLNSAYGAMANPAFRYYAQYLSESITLTGQLTIQWIEKEINLYLNTIFKTNKVDYIIASDTDSLYICLDTLVEKTYKGKNPTTQELMKFLDDVSKKMIEPFIAKTYDKLADYINAFEQKMRMKRESICDQAVWTGKKRYILNVWNSEGVAYEKAKIKIKGLETVKSTTPQIIKSKLKEAISLIFNGKEEQVQGLLNDFKKDYYKLNFEDIAFSKGMKGLMKYSGKDFGYLNKTPIHVRSAIVYNKMISNSKLEMRYPLIQEGERIKYCYLTLPNPTHENIIGSPNILPRQLGLEKYIDYDTMFDKTFVKPLTAIMNARGWETVKESSLW